LPPPTAFNYYNHSASVVRPDDGTFEVEHSDTDQHIHERVTATDITHIAKDLTVWLAGRD
jgi:hypothetical protein